MDVRTATPAEIDTEIARLRGEEAKLENLIHHTQGKLADLAKMATWQRRAYYTGPDDAELNQRIIDAKGRIAEIDAEVTPFEAEFVDRHGWSRFYLVDGGHLHYDVSSYRCSRQSSTTHYWMTEFSGMDSDTVINGDGAHHRGAGERVCTVCFPDAPVNPRPASGRFMTMTEAERAAYTEDTARKRAAKKAAELKTAEGGPVIVGHWRDRLRTERAAWNWLMRTAENFAHYGESATLDDDIADRAGVELVLPILAEVRKTTVDALRKELNAKTARKFSGRQVKTTV